MLQKTARGFIRSFSNFFYIFWSSVIQINYTAVTTYMGDKIWSKLELQLHPIPQLININFGTFPGFRSFP